MVVRQGPGGRALLEGEQVQVGGNEVYVSLCRKHFRSATGDRGGRGPPLPSQQPSQRPSGGDAPEKPTEEPPHNPSHNPGLGPPLPPPTPVPLTPVALTPVPLTPVPLTPGVGAPEGGLASTRDSDRESPC